MKPDQTLFSRVVALAVYWAIALGALYLLAHH